VSAHGTPLGGAGGRRFVVVHEADAVATLLDDERGCARLGDGRPCAPGVPFGHKVALRAIGAGEPVVKYGVAIGVATRPIAEGEHVHVHNCR
jgi:hypothetical protein